MNLDHEPIEVIRRLLVDEALGTMPSDASDWPIGVSSELATPDNTITIYGPAGTTQGRLNPTKEVVDQPGLQFRIRGTDFTTTSQKARAIVAAIDDVVKQEVAIASSTYIVWSIPRSTDVIPIGNDPDTNRSILTVNARVILSQSS